MRPKSFMISLVIPVHNEIGNLKWHHDQITRFFDSHKLQREIIYVDDGSFDGSLEAIQEISTEDSSVSYISLSRNFGKEAATSAGIEHSHGNVVIMMDADGQHPVSLIDDFLQEWDKGYEVVIGVRKQNQDEGYIKKYGSRFHNIVSRSLTSENTPAGSTDFRLIDRKVVDEFNRLTERNRVTRGLIDWLGFKRKYVNFTSPARHSGKANYSFRKLVRLALHSFISQSTKPLQFTGFFGCAVIFVTAIMGTFLIVEKYLLGDPLELAVTGTAILAIFLSFLVGIVLICQWFLALYIESIHNETQNRPLYIISKKSK